MAVKSDHAAAALVREYLSRKGYKNALAELDKERPRSSSDLTSRVEIMKELKLERLVKHNRDRVQPLSTMLEILAENLLQSERSLRPVAQGPGPAPTTSLTLPQGGPLHPRPARPFAGTTSPGKFHATCSELPSRQERGDPTSTRASEASNFTLSGQRGAQLAVRAGTLNGSPCDLSGLHDCEILIGDWSSQVTVDDCSGCLLLIGPVGGSVMLRNCSRMQVTAACQQYRCRDCADCTSHVFTLGAVVENSSQMRFGPWNANYDGASAGIEPCVAHLCASRLNTLYA